MSGRTHYSGAFNLSFYVVLYLDYLGWFDMPIWLLWLLLYPSIRVGGVLPDIDQPYVSCPLRGLFWKWVHMLVHSLGWLCGGLSHRSLVTHSEGTLAVIGMLWWVVSKGYLLVTTSVLGQAFVAAMLLGLFYGVLIHILLDCMTMAGAPSLILTLLNCLVSGRFEVKVFRFVPKMKKFGVGSSWEEKVHLVLNWVGYLGVCLVVGRMMGYV